MKTEIFKHRASFLDRIDRTLNGVTQEFADANSGWADEKNNKGCWNSARCSDCSDCSDCYGCSDCSDCSDCYGCYGCSDCSGCSGCSDCSDCSGCYGCSGCSRCSDCYGCSRCSDCSGCYGSEDVKKKKGDKGAMPQIPVIKNIHQTVLAAVESPEALDMSDWHSCETKHCRAGWIVHKAGEAGYALEKRTSTLFAALQIVHASSPIKVSPVRFFDDNERAMADIKRCAAEEAALKDGAS